MVGLIVGAYPPSQLWHNSVQLSKDVNARVKRSCRSARRLRRAVTRVVFAAFIMPDSIACDMPGFVASQVEQPLRPRSLLGD